MAGPEQKADLVQYQVPSRFWKASMASIQDEAGKSEERLDRWLGQQWKAIS